MVTNHGGGGDWRNAVYGGGEEGNVSSTVGIEEREVMFVCFSPSFSFSFLKFVLCAWRWVSGRVRMRGESASVIRVEKLRMFFLF